jgi:hypothetical protein
MDLGIPNIKVVIATGTVLGAFSLAACGEDDSPGGAKQETEQSSPAWAVSEVDKTSQGLDKAVDQLRSGGRKAAEETVAETYLNHFELVEGPLDKADHELNEELEEGISGELRAKIRRGASAKEVEGEVDALQDDLATARKKLEE